MIMGSFENQIRDSITMMEITAPRLIPDVQYVQYVYVLKFAKSFFIFANPFMISIFWIVF